MASLKKYLQSIKEATVTHGEFTGKILVIGYGSIGQPTTVLISKHLDLNPDQITLLEKDDHSELFNSRHKNSGIKYVPKTEITRKNYKTILSKYLDAGDMIVNCSLNIDVEAILTWCMDNDVMQVDTSLERWSDDQDEGIPNLAERTLYHTHKILREKLGNTKGKATCVVTHGANPGYVTHLTKRALLTFTKTKEAPTDQEGWAKLMESSGVKVVHIAERDTQVIDDPKLKNEFVNSWSCEGFWAEGRAPSEMGWGTHEYKEIEGGALQKDGTAAYIKSPSVTNLVKSWVPEGGQYNGFCVQHSEAITISEYFTTKDGKFRPSVYYVYQPTDAAIASIHELRGRELDMQIKYRIIKNEIISGMDELGVLLIGDDFVYFHGSQISIEDARKLIPGESATSVQVAGSLLGAIAWMIKNPKMGYTEPEELPYDEILAIGDKYWSPLVHIKSEWTPAYDVNSLFKRDYDKKNKCSFNNFRVWD